MSAPVLGCRGSGRCPHRASDAGLRSWWFGCSVALDSRDSHVSILAAGGEVAGHHLARFGRGCGVEAPGAAGVEFEMFIRQEAGGQQIKLSLDIGAIGEIAVVQMENRSFEVVGPGGACSHLIRPAQGVVTAVSS